MRTRGLPEAGLRQLHDAMAGHVSAGSVAGMVLTISRGDDVHVEAIGTAAADGSEPIRPDDHRGGS